MKVGDLGPGWRTDFFLHDGDVVVSERADCIVVRTPALPTYYWGNLLLLPRAPRDEDLAHWRRRFDAEIAHLQPLSRHVAIGVDAAPAGEVLPAWRADGFELILNTVMQLDAAAALRTPPPARADASFRLLDLATEAAAAVDLQCSDGDGFEAVGYRAHRQAQMQRYADLARAGRAAWFGVWCSGSLVAGCGLVRRDGGSECRFQHVMTHPAWRRRGLCGKLIEGACRWAFEHWRAQRLVMCADPEDVAIGIYRGLGFVAVDGNWSLERRAPQDLPLPGGAAA